MNRRQFTQRLSALFVSPLLPAPALSAITSSLSAAARPLHNFKHPYAWAAFTARLHGKASPEMFEKQMGLSVEDAKKAYNVLIHENVVSMPNALGISRALNPINNTQAELVEINAKKRIQQALKREQELLKAETTEGEDDSPSVNHDLANSQDDDPTQAAPDPLSQI